MTVQRSGVTAPAFLNLWNYIRYVVSCMCWRLCLWGKNSGVHRTKDCFGSKPVTLAVLNSSWAVVGQGGGGGKWSSQFSSHLRDRN